MREGYFGSADHPTGVELYTVHVQAKRGAYLYQVDGRGTLHDHYFVDASGVHGLPLPDWFGDAGVKQNLLAARQLDEPKEVSGLT